MADDAEGEERPRQPGRLERQVNGMDLDEMLDELPKVCDHGIKKNAKGFLEAWRGYKTSLDNREGGVFAGVGNVAEKVMPATEAVKELQQAVTGTAAAARDVAAIREAVVDSRSAVDEVATIRETVTDSRKAIADVVAMKPVLDKVEKGLKTWSTNTRRLR